MSSSLVQPINNFETGGRDAASRARRSLAKPHGRYDGRPARLPPGGELARPPKSRNVDVDVAAIVDPMGDGEERILATVNRRVDILETERSRKLISESAYRVGRQLQAVFERLGGIGSTNWCGASRIDPMLANELKILNSVMSAQEIAKVFERMRGRLGMIDTRLVKRILGDRMSYADCAAHEGKAGERGTTYIASRFRHALEDLAEAWVGKGKTAPPPDDKHKAVALDMDERQQASMEAGVTTERKKLEAEQARAEAEKIRRSGARRAIAGGR